MSQPPKTTERRLHRRYTLDGTIALGDGQKGSTILKDLSRSGLSCLSAEPFEDMTILEITIPLPFNDRTQQLTVSGAVVRCDAQEDGRHVVAIFFTQLDQENGQLLDSWLEFQGS